jgi:hypothetical protein
MINNINDGNAGNAFQISYCSHTIVVKFVDSVKKITGIIQIAIETS